MRVVSWNCRMALHEKWEAALELAPDILIVPEAACPTVLRSRGVPLPEDVEWVGGYKHQGLLVAAFDDYRLRVADIDLPGLRWVLPLVATGPEAEFTLLAVFDVGKGDPDAAKPDAVATALARHERLFAGGDVVLAGDLNISMSCDRPTGTRNFAPTIEKLKGLGYVSAYHAHRGEDHGAESEWTYYHGYAEQAALHVDFCFVPASWRIGDVAVGDYEPWVSHRRSDHAPVVVDVSPT
jgi:exodeoxyribonuclease III